MNYSFDEHVKELKRNSVNKTPPAEWENHWATIVAWPTAADLWEDDLASAQAEWIQLCQGIVTAPHSGKPDRLVVVVKDAEDANAVKARLLKASIDASLIQFVYAQYGDIWVRDTAPLFWNQKQAFAFRFNGWGNKYLFEPDVVLAEKIASQLQVDLEKVNLCTEGGALEWNDDQTLLTTDACLVDDQRNPGHSKETIEQVLLNSLHMKKVVWIKRGLLNDHTDGHIDTIVRFGPHNTLFYMTPTADDPNQEVLLEIRATIQKNFPEHRFIEVPSPGRVLDSEGEVMPASYMNFYISNGAVIVPLYNSPNDARAVEIIGAAFPTRKALGIRSTSILTGGGSFHCITQQIPNEK